jgi:hypothetical protein
VLANYYRDRSDSMGWHSDNEPELGPQPVIASLSFGITRRFEFRHKQSKQKASIELQHGSLLIMRGTTQAYWEHALPKLALKQRSGSAEVLKQRSDSTKQLALKQRSNAQEIKNSGDLGSGVFSPTRINLTFRYIKTPR